jgi:hypothetical protein
MENKRNELHFIYSRGGLNCRGELFLLKLNEEGIMNKSINNNLAKE